MKRVLFALLALAGLAAITGIGAFLRSEFTSPDAPVVAAVEPIIAAPSTEPASDAGTPTAATPAPRDEREIGARLEAMGDRIAQREVGKEACRLAVLWLQVDAQSALAWIRAHRGDARFDPVVASVSQAYLAGGDFETAQDLAGFVVDPSTRNWLHEEAWSVAIERGVVLPERLQNAGLSPAAADSIRSGSRRD